MDPVEERCMPATEEATAELFDDIDAPYFMESGFDATNYELQKMLGEEFELDELERERFKLKRQLQVVSKKVSALIKQNSLTFNNQVRNYSEIQTEADAIVRLIRTIRAALEESRVNCKAALGVVANHRNQRHLAALKAMLHTLKTLHETEYRLKELIEEGDFPAAIQLNVEALNAAQRYAHFSSVRQLSEKLSKVLESMEAHIDDALAATTLFFDTDRYSLVTAAYQMLGEAKSEGAALKLQTFFQATIDSSARSVVVAVLRRGNGEGGQQPVDGVDAMSFEQLCGAIPDDQLPRSVEDMARVMYKVLSLYHSVLRHHVEEDERLLGAVAQLDGVDLDAPPIVEKGVFQKSLIDNLYAIFNCASNKFNTLLCCHDLAALKFDDFIQVVELSNRFRKFGRKHFGNACAEVGMTLEKQTNVYFGRYHMERMDELKMFLENEIFALCPVSVQFTLFDLAEFHFLKESTDAFDDLDGNAARIRQLSAEPTNETLGEQLDFTLLSAEEVESGSSCPFLSGSSGTAVNGVRNGSNGHDDGQEESRMGTTSRCSSSASEESSYSGDEMELKNSMPNLCNTALNLLRFIGKYIRMTSILHSISEPAILAIIQLYKYILYSTYSFFCSDAEPIPQSDVDFSSLRLRNSIEAIRKGMIAAAAPPPPSSNSDSANEAITTGAGSGGGTRFAPCHPSPCIQLHSPDALFGLAERIVGVESMIFLSKQLELLRPVLESLLVSADGRSKTSKAALDDFYKSVLPVSVDLRSSSYGCVATRALNYNLVVKQMTTVNWEVNELQSQQSAYVDCIVNEVAVFNQRLSRISEFAHVTQELSSTIWSTLLSCIFRTLVQGNSEASKKCSNEGRALMLLDFELLSRELETLTGLRPLPHKSYLENYIKAFYLPASDLDEWIVRHTEYTVNQVTVLLNATSSGNRSSTKSRLITMLDS